MYTYVHTIHYIPCNTIWHLICSKSQFRLFISNFWTHLICYRNLCSKLKTLNAPKYDMVFFRSSTENLRLKNSQITSLKQCRNFPYLFKLNLRFYHCLCRCKREDWYKWWILLFRWRCDNELIICGLKGQGHEIWFG